MSRRALILPFALLAACPAPEEAAPASFAEATTAQREAALHAALGTGPALGFVALVGLEPDAVTSVTEGGCLDVSMVSQEPPAVRVAAEDCLGASGTTWDGVVTATNASLTLELLEAVDGDVELIEGPMALAFEAFAMRSDGFEMRFDGTVDQSATEEGVPWRTEVALTADLDGLVLGADYAQDCEIRGDAAWCDVDRGATGRVPGLGAFDITGGFSLGMAGTAPGGEVVLEGLDVLRLDLDAIDAEGCAPVTVDGAPAEPFCLAVAPVDPHPDHAVVSGGLGCDGSGWFLDATVEGDGITAVRATLYGATTEAHPLAYASTGDLGSFWQTQVAIGATYEAGTSSAIACASDDLGVTSADVLLEAVAVDGEVLACAIVGQGDRVPASACADPR